MDQEIKQLIQENLELTEENNRILKGIRASNRLAMIWRIFYIAVILGGAIVAFNFLRPYIEGVQQTYQSFVETQTKIEDGFKSFIKPR